VGRSVLHSDLCAGADAVVSYETIADTMVRHGPNYGENFTGSRCVRHEPTALNMCHSVADQPPRRFPRAILSLTGDALNPALFADIVIPERDEPARRRHLNAEELSAAACARRGAAAPPKSGPRRRPLRHADVAFACLLLRRGCHRTHPSYAPLQRAQLLEDLIFLFLRLPCFIDTSAPRDCSSVKRHGHGCSPVRVVRFAERGNS
jgi:hypothetical protein